MPNHVRVLFLVAVFSAIPAYGLGGFWSRSTKATYKPNSVTFDGNKCITAEAGTTTETVCFRDEAEGSRVCTIRPISRTITVALFNRDHVQIVTALDGDVPGIDDAKSYQSLVDRYCTKPRKQVFQDNWDTRSRYCLDMGKHAADGIYNRSGYFNWDGYCAKTGEKWRISTKGKKACIDRGAPAACDPKDSSQPFSKELFTIYRDSCFGNLQVRCEKG